MTEKELLEIPRHSRIKYVGKDPAVLDVFRIHGPATALTKGLVVSGVFDNRKWNPKDGIKLYPWGGRPIRNVNPDDWVLVDSNRADLKRARALRRVGYVSERVRQQLDAFVSSFKNMKYTKGSIDRQLDSIPLADKLRILTGLSAEHKAWLQLISMDATELLDKLKKFADDPEAVVVSPEAVTNGSEGSTTLTDSALPEQLPAQ